jgi:predicted transposase/invertase (TIGR01784 family)
MKQVASLRYGVIFKKAFCDVDVFKGFVRDILGINLEITEVETEKEFDTLIGNIRPRFDLYAKDEKNRVIVDIQHRRDFDHYDRFLHYHCMALLEQVKNSENYKPKLAVYTIVVLTSGDKYKKPVSVIDFDPKDLDGKPLGEIPHKVIFICPKYLNEQTPELYREWLQVIDDSLDGSVDESLYHVPEIGKVLAHIEQDGITPDERYWMIEEYSIEKYKQESFEDGVEKGIAQGIEKGKLERDLEIARAMLAKGLDMQTIMEVTGLTENLILDKNLTGL